MDKAQADALFHRALELLQQSAETSRCTGAARATAQHPAEDVPEPATAARSGTPAKHAA